jgi:hypothetical protein
MGFTNYVPIEYKREKLESNGIADPVSFDYEMAF